MKKKKKAQIIKDCVKDYATLVMIRGQYASLSERYQRLLEKHKAVLAGEGVNRKLTQKRFDLDDSLRDLEVACQHSIDLAVNLRSIIESPRQEEPSDSDEEDWDE